MFLEKIIPSQDLRDYLRSNNHTFSEKETACLIYHAENIKWPEKRQMLESLSQATKDFTLIREIKGKIKYVSDLVERFERNNGEYFYEILLDDREWGDEDGIFFGEVQEAVKYAADILHKKNFLMRKNKIHKGKIEIGTYAASICSYDMWGKHEVVVLGDEYWNEDHTPKVRESYLKEKFIVYPIPFEKGDVVKIIGTNVMGVIETSSEEWEEMMKRGSEGEDLLWGDEVLTIITLEENGYLNYRHVSPMKLQRIYALSNKCKWDILKQISKVIIGEAPLSDLIYVINVML